MAKMTTKYAGDFPAADAGGRRNVGRGWVDIPLHGGMITSRPRQLLQFGQASLVRNLRGGHPGYWPRGGSKKLHTTAVGSLVANLFHFCKGRSTERHFLAQFADGTIREATSAPPAVTTGAFGSNIFSGGGTPYPATWAVMDDILIFSTGADLPQFWIGDEDRVDGFFVYRGELGETLPYVPDKGLDFTVEVTDDDTDTYANLGSLQPGIDCLMIRTALPRVSAFHIAISGFYKNTASSSITIQKCYAGGVWATVGTVTDTTADGGRTLYQNGSWTFAPPDQIEPVFYQGVCGYWWRVLFSTALSSTVRVAKVSYSADVSPLEVMWDSLPTPAVECQLHASGQDIYYRYDYTSSDLSAMATADKFYMCFADPVEAIYLDPGESPNANSVFLTKVGRWNGTTWVESSPKEDNTHGLNNPGWVHIGQGDPALPDRARQFQGNQWRGYWYYIYFSAALSDDVLVSAYGRPFYNTSDFGKKCICCAAWKQRALYVFDRYPQYIYVSAINKPMVLRGNDSNILTPGDGRAHAVRAIVCFHNEILVLQEEHGTIGGCTTLYQGRDDATFGKRILSTRVGGWHAKAVALVEGVYLTTATDQRVATVVYWLSWNGVVRCDGRGVMDVVSDAVADRFDPLKTATCVRRGYEDQCGLFYDRSCHVLRVWLVCGPTATAPNWFGIYDLVDGSWTEDDQAAHYTAMCEAEAASGDVAVIQVAGDSAGQVRQLNTGTTDDGAAIACRADFEFGMGGRWTTLQDVRARIEAAAGASVTLAAARDGRSEDAKYTLSAPLDPKVAGEETVTVSRPLKVGAGQVTLAVSGTRLELHNLAVRATVEEER